jgi:hypothetical protein
LVELLMNWLEEKDSSRFSRTHLDVAAFHKLYCQDRLQIVRNYIKSTIQT